MSLYRLGWVSVSMGSVSHPDDNYWWLVLVDYDQWWLRSVVNLPKRVCTSLHIASISNSIMAYQNSASVRKWEPVWMRYHVPLFCCCKIKPGTYQLHPCTSEWAYWHHKLTALVLLSVHPLLLWLRCHVYHSTKIILKLLVDECSEWC